MQESTQDKLSSIGIGAGMLLMLAVGLIQVIATWFGWADLVGWGWTIPLLFVSFLMRFMLPITIGTFLCALNVWDWHWVFAALFAAPGLIMMVPGVLLGMIGALRGKG